MAEKEALAPATSLGPIPLLEGISVSVAAGREGWVTSFSRGGETIAEDRSVALPWIDPRAPGRLAARLHEAVPLDRNAIRAALLEIFETIRSSPDACALVSGPVARATGETPAHGETAPAKYVKQIVTDGGPKEPIFGAWSVLDGEPLVVTEGIADALAVLQDCRPCISPVTTSFKRERIDEAAAFCRRAGAVSIVNDNEESGAGMKGAARTALALMAHGIERVYVGTLPRPDGVEKIDLNDFLRGGGDLAPVLADAVPAADHPAVKEERRQAVLAGVASLRSAVSRQRRVKKTGGDIEGLKRRMPSLSAYTGIAPGKRGAHPVYGSTHGDNFAVSADGETWTSFHGGSEKGKSANIFKLIALEQGFLSDEGASLRGEAFLRTVAYCRERWGGR